MSWTREEAVELCVKVEAVAPSFGWHVGLTGGLLYKQGERKDCDLLLYRIRQNQSLEVAELFSALAGIGINIHASYGFCNKATIGDKSVDLLIPELGGDYSRPEQAIETPANLFPELAAQEALK